MVLLLRSETVFFSRNIRSKGCLRLLSSSRAFLLYSFCCCNCLRALWSSLTLQAVTHAWFGHYYYLVLMKSSIIWFRSDELVEFRTTRWWTLAHFPISLHILFAFYSCFSVVWFWFSFLTLEQNSKFNRKADCISFFFRINKR